ALKILKAVGQPILGTEILDPQNPQCELWAPLSPGDANYNCRDVFYINEGVKIFRAGQRRKMDHILVHLRDFAAHFFSRSQVHLDSFACATLKTAEDARDGWKSGFALCM